MLTQVQAQKLAREYKTTVDNVVKEHYQIYILDKLFESKIGDRLVFKGGTALKLGYQSFRYSEDLDFSIVKKIDFGEFRATIEKVSGIFPEAVVKDVHDKRNTLFAKITFRVDYKPVPLGIKIEINKEKVTNKSFGVGLIKSDFNNLIVTGYVYKLKKIYQDKLKLLKARREPRDLFDLWFASQLLNKRMVIKSGEKYTKREIMDGLNPFIPENHKKILTLFTKNEN